MLLGVALRLGLGFEVLVASRRLKLVAVGARHVFVASSVLVGLATEGLDVLAAVVVLLLRLLGGATFALKGSVLLRLESLLELIDEFRSHDD